MQSTVSLVLTVALFTQAQTSPSDKPKMDKTASSAKAQSIYDFTVKDIDGKDVKLDRYRGDVLVVINTASR